jgi:2-polyprenyl-3-methyl-5-hydroxy-6-metoxy-1,4-benzoquinol methylase
MLVDLSQRAVNLSEAMDSADCDATLLTRTYAQFPTINHVLSGWGLLYQKHIRPELTLGARSILDIGCGGGDVLRQLALWARRDGFDEVRCLGIDPDVRAIAFARAQANPANIRFVATHSTALTERSDIVLSNHVLHHLSNTEVTALCSESERLARRLVLHNDIARSPLAYRLFPLAGLILRRSYIVPDGLISIRRSFTATELRSLLPKNWEVASTGAFRLQAIWRP